MQIMDGRKIADRILGELTTRVAALRARGVTPTLGIFLAGDDPRSATYVRVKQRAAERIGVRVRVATTEPNPLQPSFAKGGSSSLSQREVRWDLEPVEATVTGIEAKIDEFNRDPSVHGMILQLPLPNELNDFELTFIERIDPAKDADGLHPMNFGRLLRGYQAITPATPRGVMKLLAAYEVSLVGKRVTLIGFGKLVGRALATLLIRAGATLTIATRRTRDLAAITREAEVVISAAGVAGLVTADMVSSDVVLVDVGLSDVDEQLVGDIADEAKEKARLATPVPGGVGPMTVAMLLQNVVEATERYGQHTR